MELKGLGKKLKYQWMPTGAWDTFKGLLNDAIHCVEQHGIPYIMPSLQN
jgi:hypothetical protein